MSEFRTDHRTPHTSQPAPLCVFVGEFIRHPDDFGWASGTFASLRNSGLVIGGALGPNRGGGQNPPLKACGFGSHHNGHFCFGDGSVRFNPSRGSLQSMLDRAEELNAADFWTQN